MKLKTYTRTILKTIDDRVATYPILLLTGPRQVGKSTAAYLFKEKGYNYLSFDDILELKAAKEDPEFFLSSHKNKLILDEIQRAPELFPYLEKEVNQTKLEKGDNSGLFILTGSQIYSSMSNITESLAGRVSILRMSPLSRNEIIGHEEAPLKFDPLIFNSRAKDNPLSEDELLNLMFRGGYPKLWENKQINPFTYYPSYIDTYLKKDIADILKIKDDLMFSSFLQVLASFTGQELVYDSIAKAVGVDNKTIKSWIGVLSACGIIFLLQPYSDTSIVKRIRKRPKLYFIDTGLVCSLLRIDSPKTLHSSFFYGRIYETYVVNEILKSYRNNGIEPSLYYYRDDSRNEIDLMLVENATLHPIVIKAGITYNEKTIKSFACLKNLSLPLGNGFIICSSDKSYPINKDVWALPLAGL